MIGAGGGYLVSRAQAAASVRAAREQSQAAQLSAREQIRAQTVVASRQRWIDELRDEISKMLGILLLLQMTLEKRDDENHQVWMREVIAASALEGKIALMLNPNEAEHEALALTIRAALNDIRMGKKIDWGSRTTEILEAGRVVLKNAWDQIRNEIDGARASVQRAAI